MNKTNFSRLIYNVVFFIILMVAGGMVQTAGADYLETFTAQNSSLTPSFSFVAGSSNYGYNYFINLSTLTVNITDYSTNTSCSDPYSCIDTTGVIGWWHFDEASGNTVTDSSSQGNNGVWTGNNTNNYTTGKYNNAGNFTKENASYVIVGDEPVYDFGTNDFSVFFISLNLSNNPTIVSKSGTGFSGWRVVIDSVTGKLALVATDTLASNSILTDNKYNNTNTHFAVAGREGGNWFIETEAEARKTSAVTLAGGINSAGKNLAFGSRNVVTDANISSSFDEVIIFNRAISSSEFKNMTYTKLKSLQVNATGNDTASSVWNSASDNPLIVPVNTTNKITGLNYTLPSSMVLNGITVYDYRNSTKWNLTASTTLYWDTIDWVNNSYRNANYTRLTSNGEPIENAVATLDYGIVKGNNISFLFYLAVDHSIYGISYNHTSRTYSSPTFVAYSRTDNHGYASPVIDSDGYIHIFYGGHVQYDPIYHRNTTQPYNISNWTSATQAITCNDVSLANCEYPSAVVNSTGAIWVIYKTTSIGSYQTNGINVTVSTDNGASWSTPIKLVNSSTVIRCGPCDYPTYWSYFGGLGIGNTNNLSFIFNFYNITTIPATRTNLSFMNHNFTDADNIWRMSTSAQYTLPANDTYIEDLNPGTGAYPGNTFFDANGNTWVLWHNITTHKLIVKYLNASGAWNDASPSFTNVTPSTSIDVGSQILVVNGTIYIYTALKNPLNANYQDIKLLTSSDNGTTYTIRTIVENISLATQRTTFTSSLLYPDNTFDVAWSNNGSIYFTSFNEKVRSEARTTNIYLNVNNSVQPSLAVSYDIDNISALTSVNLSATPSSDTVDIYPTTWNTAGDYRKTWTESSTNHSLTTQHTIGDFPANTQLNIKVDGILSATTTSNNTGYISFTYTGGYSSHEFDISLRQVTALSNNWCDPYNSNFNNTFVFGSILTFIVGAVLLFLGFRTTDFKFMITGILIIIASTITLVLGNAITSRMLVCT